MQIVFVLPPFSGPKKERRLRDDFPDKSDIAETSTPSILSIFVVMNSDEQVSCLWKTLLKKSRVPIWLTISQSRLCLLHFLHSYTSKILSEPTDPIFFENFEKAFFFFEIGSRHPKPSVGSVGSVVDRLDDSGQAVETPSLQSQNGCCVQYHFVLSQCVMWWMKMSTQVDQLIDQLSLKT